MVSWNASVGLRLGPCKANLLRHSACHCCLHALPIAWPHPLVHAVHNGAPGMDRCPFQAHPNSAAHLPRPRSAAASRAPSACACPLPCAAACGSCAWRRPRDPPGSAQAEMGVCMGVILRWWSCQERLGSHTPCVVLVGSRTHIVWLASHCHCCALPLLCRPATTGAPAAPPCACARRAAAAPPRAPAGEREQVRAA